MSARPHVLGLIALLALALILPMPAWARTVYTEPGTTTSPTIDVFGNAQGNIANGSGQPGLCESTLLITDITDITAVNGITSTIQSPPFSLARTFGTITFAPSIIKVTFNVRFSTDESVTAPVFIMPDHFLARLITAAGPYNILMIDPNGPQLGSVASPTTVTGFTGFTPANADFGLSNGTGTLTVTSTFYPTGATAAKIKANPQAFLRFVIANDDVAALTSAACVFNIRVDTTP